MSRSGENQGISTPEEIDPEQMFILLLDANPSFEPIWKDFLDEWKDEESPPPYTIALDSFAGNLIEKLEAGDTSCFREIFHVIERLHFSTNDYVSNEVKGISETILDRSRFTKLHPYDFEPWLGPEARRAWLLTNKGYMAANGRKTGAQPDDAYSQRGFKSGTFTQALAMLVCA